MVPRLGSMSSNLWDPAAPCHEPNANILVPVHEAKQSVLYRSIKQTHKVVKKLFSYHFNMHLFRAKTFLCRPSSRTQTFRYRSIKQTKRSVTRSVKKTKKITTMSFSFLESKDPSTGNVCFFRFGTKSFKLWESAVPYNDSCLASRRISSNLWEPVIPCNGNLWFPGWEP